jgi:large conductance mechanosensitive channel
MVMGAAFTTLVGSMVTNVITPLTGVFGEVPEFKDLHANVGRSSILYGVFINDLLAFMIVAAVVFFFVVKPLNRVLAVHQSCPECLSAIPKDARRCASCGILLEVPAASPEEGIRS